jgi:hypothetical protein
MFDAIEAALVERAGELVPEAGAAVSLGDILEAKDKPARLALAVAYDGYKPVDAAGSDGLLESRWIVAVAVSTARQRGAAGAVRESALAIAAKLLTGLVGWRPAAGCTPFKAADPGGPLWDRERGLYLLPVAFTTRAAFSGVEED